jgi:uncharacterized membrane protein
MVLRLVAAGAAIWLAALLVTPLLPAPLAAAFYVVGSLICHQRPERSFHLLAVQLPVCARCIGIYAGAALGSAIALDARVRALRPPSVNRILLAAGAAPTVVTVACESLGWWQTTNLTRWCAGLPLGCAVALVVAQAVATLHYGRCPPRRPIESSRPSTPI